MKYNNYTPDTINEIGYQLLNDRITVTKDGISATLVNTTTSVYRQATLKKADMAIFKKPDSPTAPFPKDWFIVHAIPETDEEIEKGDHFFLSVKKPPKHRDALPIQSGDNIHRKSVNGIYRVVYVNRDIIIITHKGMAKEYHKGLRDSPVHVIFWDDYKCKEGTPSAE